MREANQMMDHCFGEIMDIITKLHETKTQHLKPLFNLCLGSANLILRTGSVTNKQIHSFVNKMFKMSDAYLAEFNQSAPADKQLNRNYINKTFDLFRKKKEAA